VCSRERVEEGRRIAKAIKYYSSRSRARTSTDICTLEQSDRAINNPAGYII
jgi:hypothetical protein